YLDYRTPAEKQAIPESLRSLAETNYAVALKLRLQGSPVARRVEAGGSNTVRNLLTAALRAMRSSQLPNRVDRKVLEALTIEVEILGEPTDTVPEDLPEAYIPGLTGLLARRGRRETRVLPSTGYILGLNADAARRMTIGKLPPSRNDASAPVRLSLQQSRHYASYPGRPAVWLYRGKRLMPMEAIGEKELARAAEAIADFTVRYQLDSGRFAPPGDRPDLVDHLYATWILARYAAARKVSDYNGAIVKAVSFAAAQRKTGKTGNVYLSTRLPADQLAAAAMYVLTVESADGIPLSAPAKSLVEQLRQSILSRAEEEKIHARLDGAATASADIRSIATAALALAGQDDAKYKNAVQVLGKSLIDRIEKDAPDTAQLLWALRVVKYPRQAKLPQTADPLASIRQNAKQMDENGGFAAADASPTTANTAHAAVLVLDAFFREGEKSQPVLITATTSEQMAARRFCYRMMYKPGEAVFSADPDSWVGAVRTSPEAAKISLYSQAAVLEALLGVVD
ncbi:MAG: hypothetical protein ACLFVU_05225, partial [Phycisphaerae bacterium]